MLPYELLSRAVAAARARESGRAERLFDDPLAEPLARAEGHDFLATLESVLPGSDASIGLAVRTRFFDDWIAASLGELGPAQVVIVGAGMDTRAFRLAWPAGSVVYELDLPELIANKEADLRAAGAAAACPRVPVGVDLAGAWPEALAAAGFRPDAPSLWLFEGLLVYLDAAVVNRLLHGAARLAAPGSRLGASLVGRAMLAHPPARPLVDHLAALGVPWRFGTDEPERFLAIYGWDTTAEQTGDVAHRLGRAPAPMPPRDLPGLPRDFLVTAKKRGRRP